MLVSAKGNVIQEVELEEFIHDLGLNGPSNMRDEKKQRL